MRTYRLALLSFALLLAAAAWAAPPRVFVDQVEVTSRFVQVDGVLYVDVQRFAQAVGWQAVHWETALSIAPTVAECTFPAEPTALIVLGQPFTGATRTDEQGLLVSLTDLVASLGGTMRELPDLRVVKLTIPRMPTAEAAQRSMPPAAAVPSAPPGDTPSAEAHPAAAGQDISYHNTSLGFTIHYGSDLFFTDDQVLLKSILSAGTDIVAKSNPALADVTRHTDVGVQFMIKPQGLGPGPLLMMVTQKVPSTSTSFTTKQVAAGVLMGVLQASPGGAGLEAPSPTKVGSLEFYSFLAQTPAPGGMTMEQRHYVYFDATNSVLYDMALMAPADKFEAGSQLLSKVVLSFRLDRP